MEEVGSSSGRVVAPPWDSLLPDVLSALVYLQEPDGGVQALVCVEGGAVRLPRRKIGHDYNAGTSAQSRDTPLPQLAQSIAAAAAGIPPPPRWTPQLLHLSKVFDPIMKRHYHHYVFAFPLDAATWSKVEERSVRQKVSLEKLKTSPVERREVVWLVERIARRVVGAHVREVSVGQLWQEMDQAQCEEELLRSPGFKEQDMELISGAFVRCSYPYATVCLEDVKQLLGDLGWQDREQGVFRALDKQRTGELSHVDFVHGLVAMDPMTPHGKRPGEIRSWYIFRYYDRDSNGVLEEEDIHNLVTDMAKLQGQDISVSAIAERTKTALEIFAASEDNSVVPEGFLSAIGTLQFRGTSLLFRASTAIIPYLVCKFGVVSPRRKSPLRDSPKGQSSPRTMKRIKRDLGTSLTTRHTDSIKNCTEEEKNSQMEVDQSNNNSQVSIPLSDGAFQSPGSRRYTLAQHTVKVRRSGQIIDTQLLLDMERAGEVSDTGFDVEKTSEASQLATDKAALVSIDKPARHFDRYLSVDAFNTKSLPNEMVAALRFFEHNRKDKPALHWGEVDLVKLGQYIISLCAAIRCIFEGEPRMLVLSSPCYVLGDLHGNYRDLICFEKALWRIGPHLTPSNFLFLGDYVDRGEYGVEVVAYLFAQKLQAPTKFFMLRGNHEVRDIQKQFTFYNECLVKFGESLGHNVWEAVNNAFDHMPLAAVIDDQVFCIHGGIPNIPGNLSEMEKIPCPLRNPEVESDVAWQVMWNDPIAPDEMTESVIEELSQNNGFAHNTKRNTACVFNRKAFTNFLQKNGITHVVRAHEVKQSGFEVQQGGQLLTVFSSSHYCGGSNEAACILLDNRRIRAIRIDTS
ncbi:uncharacterized protein LOC135091949 isoform X1 [Scylla paramamosain]|uniref:uncharacterized protein LOC135091949 isoform X1 n=2 Tax=Scylla paramamosain TaxID=85552 RepID=UPI003082A830